MSSKQQLIPTYKGLKWISDGLPQETTSWLDDGVFHGSDALEHGDFINTLRSLRKKVKWKWPKKTLFIISDPHADADAFEASLVASGGVKKKNNSRGKFKLTSEGKKGTFVIVGDCFDKGPGNLELLASIQRLFALKANVKLLAGNHDLRLLLGLSILDMPKDTHYEHFFVRMGPKVLPLLREVLDRYPLTKKEFKKLPNDAECRRQLYPSRDWVNEFPRIAARAMSKEAIDREVSRMKKKLDNFEDDCRKYGLSVREVYAAAHKCRRLFIRPKGDYYWFYDSMKLAYRRGSFLFVHAGLDDRITAMIESHGLGCLNRAFLKLAISDPFEFYYGPVANTMRTKYRNSDMPLTRKGVDRMHKNGISAIVHGHNNRTKGQLINLREGLIHFETDITLDRNSRKKEGLDGCGVGATIIRPKGQVIGISNDYPKAKVFDPVKLLST